MDLVQSSSQGNHSIVGPPFSVQAIPEPVPADVKLLLQKFPSILRTDDVVPNPSYGVEHHVHMGDNPSVFAKGHCLNPEKLEIAKAEFKCLESAGIVCSSTSLWASPLHMVPKSNVS